MNRELDRLVKKLARDVLNEDEDNREPIRTVKATKSVLKKIQALDDFKETAEKKLEELKKVLEKAKSLHEDLWAQVNVDMDLGSRYEMQYNRENEEIEIMKDTWKD